MLIKLLWLLLVGKRFHFSLIPKASLAIYAVFEWHFSHSEIFVYNLILPKPVGILLGNLLLVYGKFPLMYSDGFEITSFSLTFNI